MKKGVVVIDGHVQCLALIRSLGEKGIPVIVLDRFNCISRYSKYCLKYYECPEYLSVKFINFIIDLAEEKNLYGWMLLPCDDHIVYNISSNKKKLQKYYKIISPELNILQNIIDKTKLLSISQQLNIPLPSYFIPINGKEKSHKLRFPVIIKGKSGQTFYKMFRRKAFQANSQNELEQQLDKIKSNYFLNDVFVQELIPYNGSNKTVSFTAFSINGEIKAHWSGVKLREHPIQFGTATFCKSVFQKELIEISETLLKKLKYTGVCEVEYLKDPRDNKYKIIEINPRTWLWVGLAKDCGIDFPIMIYNYLNKIDTTYPKDYKKDIYWINIWTDTIFSLIAMLSGKLNFFSYINSLKGKKSFGIFSLKDIKPFIMYSFLLIYFLRKR